MICHVTLCKSSLGVQWLSPVLSIYFTHHIHTCLSPMVMWVIYMDTAQGGIWTFSPLSRWNVNTPVAWICQMSTWYFKVASWLRLFFFFLVPVWGGRRGCSALQRHTHKSACTHTPRCSPQHMYWGSGVGEWDRPAGSHVNTHWHSNREKKERKMHIECSTCCIHNTLSAIPSPGHVFSLTECNGIPSDYCDPPGYRSSMVVWV